jgi:hypothetical protein
MQEYFENYTARPLAEMPEKRGGIGVTEKLEEGVHYLLDNRPCGATKGKEWVAQSNDLSRFPWRKQSRKLYRFWHVNPGLGPLFYLVLLLKNGIIKTRIERPATVEEGYRKTLEYGGEVYPTWEKLAREQIPHVLLGEDLGDLYWKDLLEMEQSPAKLRWAFVLLVVNLQWDCSRFEEHWLEMVDPDWQAEKEAEKRRRVLADIRRRLRANGRTLADMGFPASEMSDEQEHGLCDGDRDSLALERAPRREQLRTEDQQPLHDDALGLLQDVAANLPGDRVTLWAARAGSGKTFLSNALIRSAKEAGLRLIVCATTGIAAGELTGGRTAHKALALPISTDKGSEKYTISLPAGTKQWNELRDAHGILLDEGYMLNGRYFDAVNAFLQKCVAASPVPAQAAMAKHLFAGKVFVLSGDERQLPPVVPSIAELLCQCFQATVYFERARRRTAGGTPTRLTVSARLASDPSYADWLEELAVNAADRLEFQGSKSAVIPRVIFPAYVRVTHEQAEAVEHLFGEELRFARDKPFLLRDEACRKNAAAMCENGYLCSVNATTRQVNDLITDALAGEVVTLPSTNEVLCDGERWSVGYFSGEDFLSTVHDGAHPPGVLRVKPGSVVMTMCNLAADLTKYTKCVVVSATPTCVRLIRASDLLSPNWAKCVFALPRTRCSFTHQHLEVQRTQFPIAPAWAYTIHKSQGQTLHRVVLDVANGDVFSHGMLYVACSRVRNSKHFLILCRPDDVSGDGRAVIRNVVLKPLVSGRKVDTGVFSRDLIAGQALERALRDTRRRPGAEPVDDDRAAAPEGTRTDRKCYVDPATRAVRRQRFDNTISRALENDAESNWVFRDGRKLWRARSEPLVAEDVWGWRADGRKYWCASLEAIVGDV